MYVEKYGLNTSTPSFGFRNASQKNCSNTLAPGPTAMFSASAGMPNSSLTKRAADSRNSGKPGDGQ